MKRSNIFKTGVLFIIGFCLYITIEVCFRGYSFIMMGVCGGFLFVAIDCINDKISWEMDLILQGIIGSIMITLCELIIGESRKLFHLQPMWDYSNMLFNFDGVICLEFSLIWVAISIVAILVADAINYYIFDELPIPYYKIFGFKVFEYKEK